MASRTRRTIAVPVLSTAEQEENRLVTLAKHCLEGDLIQRHRTPFRRAASHVVAFQSIGERDYLKLRDTIERRLREDPELQRICDSQGKLLDMSIAGRIRQAVHDGGTQTWGEQEESSVA